MKRTETPEVLKDFELNKFITGKLLDARETGDGLADSICNTLIERTVDQLRKPFEDEYAAAQVKGGNVTSFPPERPAGVAS